MGSVAGNNTAYMPQRNNSVDMIGELPDIDFFSIPGVKCAICCWKFRMLMALAAPYSTPISLPLPLLQLTTFMMTM